MIPNYDKTSWSNCDATIINCMLNKTTMVTPCTYDKIWWNYDGHHYEQYDQPTDKTYDNINHKIHDQNIWWTSWYTLW